MKDQHFRLYLPLFRILVCVICFLSLLAIPERKEAVAQSQGVIRWTKPVIIADVEGVAYQTMYPIIAADVYGTIHVFWTTGRGIYYISSKDGDSWSSSIDVVWSNSGNVLFPSVVIDQRGYMHLIWEDNGDIYYRSVHVRDAGIIRNWSTVRQIADIGMAFKNIEIAVDSSDRLHVVFVEFYTYQDKTKSGNVYHLMSEDHGNSWSKFHQVSNVPDNEMATDPRIAFDSQNRIHIVWGEMAPLLSGQQQGVHYARLSPSGEITEVQREIDHRKPDTTWMMSINIAILPSNEVNLVWTCTSENSWRCHTWSSDGGDSWHKNRTYFDNLIGHSGWDAVPVDGKGNLTWITVLRYPQAMYYSMWDGENWIDPPLPAASEGGMQVAENVRATVNLGNQIHVVAHLSRFIYYMRGETSAPKIRAVPLLTIEPVLNPTSSELSTGSQVEQPIATMTPALLVNNKEVYNLNSTSGQILFLSIIPVILILTGVRIFKSIKR